jgi:hypothetical protein
MSMELQSSFPSEDLNPFHIVGQQFDRAVAYLPPFGPGGQSARYLALNGSVHFRNYTGERHP